MLTRRVLFAALALTGLAAPLVHAQEQGPDPRIVLIDDYDDAASGADIWQVSYATTKTPAGTPDKIVITLTFSNGAPPEPLTAWNYTADTTSCGQLYIYTYWSLLAQDHATGISGDCTAEPTVTVKDTSFIYTFSAAALGVKKGSAFSNHYMWSTLAEPLSGFGLGDFESSLSDDTAEGVTPYIVP